jgi:hypothetical protein
MQFMQFMQAFGTDEPGLNPKPNPKPGHNDAVPANAATPAKEPGIFS